MLEYQVNDRVRVNMPLAVGGRVMHADKLRQFNHKAATITAVQGDKCRLDIDDGKYEWPAFLLARPMQKDTAPSRAAYFDVRPAEKGYKIYLDDDTFVSSADTIAEAEQDIEEYKREINEVGFLEWMSAFLNRREKLAAMLTMNKRQQSLMYAGMGQSL